jgi:hypothetical protein
MKKLSICLTIMTSCVILHAQKIEPPSFRDYLHNKNRFIKAEPPVLMMPGANHNYQHNIKDLPALIGARKAPFAEVLSNGNKVYLLPQDNMPCIVPDMKQFNMPVVAGDNSLDKKINVLALPEQIIP